jgi:hypothetical protein
MPAVVQVSADVQPFLRDSTRCGDVMFRATEETVSQLISFQLGCSRKAAFLPALDMGGNPR